MSRKIVVVGGHGKVALHFARQASQEFDIVSLVRSKHHFADIEATGATPTLLSLEDSTVDDLANLFQGAFGVLFSAGAGGKGGPARTKAVDYEGALKVFDAVQKLSGDRPHVVLVGAIDTRDLSKPAPAHYNAKDIEASERSHAAIGVYYQWKLEADKDLVKRTAFPWTILRPGLLLDSPGTGKIALGKPHIGAISREDVAATLLQIFQTEASKGFVWDLTAGDTSIATAIQDAIKENVTITYEPAI